MAMTVNMVRGSGFGIRQSRVNRMESRAALMVGDSVRGRQRPTARVPNPESRIPNRGCPCECNMSPHATPDSRRGGHCRREGCGDQRAVLPIVHSGGGAHRAHGRAAGPGDRRAGVGARAGRGTRGGRHGVAMEHGRPARRGRSAARRRDAAGDRGGSPFPGPCVEPRLFAIVAGIRARRSAQRGRQRSNGWRRRRAAGSARTRTERGSCTASAPTPATTGEHRRARTTHTARRRTTTCFRAIFPRMRLGPAFLDVSGHERASSGRSERVCFRKA
jgi:hypothetical protein